MKIALFGATGRLGRALASLAFSQPDLQISEAIAHLGSPSLGEELLPKLLITASFCRLSDLAIDVSLPREAPSSLAAALEAKIPLVIGTTALPPSAMEQIRLASREIPIFYTPNFSIGMALFKRFCLEAASRLPACTLDLFEAHHAAKIDTPSGSALLLSREMEKAGKAVSIHSMRSGKIVGEHTLILNTDEEKLEISHTAHSRAVFAKGALEAARFLQTQKPGLYGMDDLLLYLKA